MNTGTASIAELADRIAALEDEREVRNVIIRFCFAIDADELDALLSLHWDDCIAQVDGRSYPSSRDNNPLTSPVQRSFLPNCSHIMAPLLVKIDGDRAAAVGYSNMLLKNADAAGAQVFRQSYNRFELNKRDGVWKISRRDSRLVGSAEAQALLKQALMECMSPGS
jgi:hypothetical protein